MNRELYLISKRCLDALHQNGKRVAFAESCTGGLLSKCLTDHSGASDVFECGIVSYCGKIKHKLLGVRNETLATFGEVSAQTAEEMARGVATLSESDIGVGVTGIAGPTGNTADKKIGLIFVAIYFNGMVYGHKLELYDDISRDERRQKTALFVFSKLIELIAK